MPIPAIRKTLELDYDEALRRVPDALQAEGFGVLTEIDVQATLAKKLGVAFRRYKILGACNPPFAYRALEADRDVGVLLPCNVIVYEGDRPGTTEIRAVDPMETIAAAAGGTLAAIADEVRAKLARALDRLASGEAAVTGP